jgi:hypothetical protein
VPGGVGIPAGHERKGAFAFKNQQDNAFCRKKPQADPDPFINFPANNGIAQVENDNIEKYPDSGMKQFDSR